MPINRRTLVGLGLTGLASTLLMPFAVFLVGLAVAPVPPAASSVRVPPLIGDALWARAGGGRATTLTPITPISMAKLATCVAVEDFKDTTPGDARRVAACREYMPAIEGMEYLSRMHMRDANLRPSFREGLGRLSTTIWLTHAWTKADFLNTLGERGEFGFGFRGVESAAAGYFGRTAEQLTLPEAAMIAAFVGDRRVDPWCDPAAAAVMRRRILDRMRDDLVIDDVALEAASRAEITLTAPPAHHLPCAD